MPLYYPEDENEDYVFVYDEDSLLQQKKTKKISTENIQPHTIYGGDFVITMADSLTVKSKSKNKIFLTITEDEIIIGDVNAEHIRLKQ